jgi:hypothetical protein
MLGTIHVFQIWYKLCSELTSTWTLNIYIYSRNTHKQQTNRPQVIINQTDHRWRLGTLERPWNINENRKDIIVLFLLIVVLFGFLNIKSVQIYNDNTDQVIITTCSLEYSSCNSIRTLYEEMDIKTITQTHFVHTRFTNLTNHC